MEQQEKCGMWEIAEWDLIPCVAGDESKLLTYDIPTNLFERDMFCDDYPLLIVFLLVVLQ